MYLSKLCKLCADETEVLVSLALEDYDDIKRILGLFGFDIDNTCNVCSNCVSLLNKVVLFIEKCKRAQPFLTYCQENFESIDDFQRLRLRIDFGLEGDRSPEGSFELEVKDEFIDSNCQVEALDLEEYEEIALQNDDNFAITDDTVQNDDTPDLDSTCDELQEHSKLSEEMQLEYSCHHCGLEFKNFFSLQSHCRKEHDSNPSVLCLCGTNLTCRAQILMHRKLHKSYKNYPCKQCEKVYFHQQSLHNHIKKTHTETDKLLLMCTVDQCSKQFDSEKKLKTHRLSHLPDEKKMIFPCHYCKKQFTKSVNVQAHIKAIHHLERPFLCSDCGKNFGTKGALKEHQIIHQNIFPYQCSSCPKKFKNLPRLKTHEDIHNTTKYICNVCGISLNTKRTLKMHMVVHSDQKKYKCQYCGSSFKRSKALKNHLILHSGLRPYTCDFCDKTFANGSNCRSHKKKAHPNELAALEASGKTASSAPNIPRLEQLQPKNVIEVERVGNLIQLPVSSHDIKTNLPTMVEQNSKNFQVHSILQTENAASIVTLLPTT